MILIPIILPLLITLLGAFLLFGPKGAAAKFITATSFTGEREAPNRARMMGAGFFPVGIMGEIMLLFGHFNAEGPLAVLFLLFLFVACGTAVVLLLLWNQRRAD